MSHHTFEIMTELRGCGLAEPVSAWVLVLAAEKML
jgi:hypothetical protein